MSIAKIIRHNIVGKLANHTLVFFINVCLVRLLGAGPSGAYFNELYLINAIVFIASMGLDYAAIAWIARDNRWVPAIQRIFVPVIIGLPALLWIVYEIFGSFLQAKLQQPLLAILLFSTGNLMLILYQGLFAALKEFNRQNLLLFISNALFLLYLLNRSPGSVTIESVSLAYAVLFFAQGLLLMLLSFYRKAVPPGPLPVKPFLAAGVRIMISSVIYFAFLRVDNFFVERYCDANALGSYVQCGKIGQYFLYFSSIISSTLLPFLSAEQALDSYADWRKIIRPYGWLLLLAALVFALAGPWLFPVLYGPGFEAMHRILWIFLPGYLSLGLLTLINAVYISKGNIQRIFWGDLAGLILVTVGDWLLVPTYGVYAAAAISSGIYIALLLYLAIPVEKQFQ